MKLVEMNWNPPDRQLRQFALICLGALPFVAWFWDASMRAVIIMTGIGLVIALIGIVSPKVLKPLFVGLTLLALPIGLVVGELAMLVVFFGVILPIGLVFRLMKRDSLLLRFEPTASTYWTEKSSPTSAQSYYRQF